MTTDALNSLTSSARGVFTPPPKKTAPFSLRLSAEERADLEARAGTLALGAYIKGQLFKGQKPRRPAIRSSGDPKAMARALALLGQSRIASNLNQLARAANIGTLPLTPDVEDDLREACAHIAEIRALLIEALGLKSGGGCA
mgnify:CR=1 FL=1|jgi:hypothetical protein